MNLCLQSPLLPKMSERSRLRPLSVMAVLITASCAMAQNDLQQSSAQQKVEQLLQRADGKEPRIWAQLLIMADAEAVKLKRDTMSPECCGYRCFKIQGHQLTFRWDEIGRTEEYQHDLLKTVVLAQYGTKWGADALSRLLLPGCSGPLSADTWNPYFKTVLNILEAPHWHNIEDVRLKRILAEAYETWWSLSKAAATEPVMADSGLTADNFRDGAEQARIRAIAAYRRVLQLEPSDHNAAEHLRNLIAGKDTQQRNWYCFGE